jgi:hypothetical protein
MPRTRNSMRDTTAKDAPITMPEIQTRTKTKEKPTRITRASADVASLKLQPEIEVNTVLRDITDRYIVSPVPQTISKRKPKLPTRKTVPPLTISNRIQSSLPPSSPPSTSSHVPVATSCHFPEINPLSSDPIDADPYAVEDPFGFFAVEEKLKANRLARVPPVPRSRRIPSSDSVDASADESLQEAFATPKPVNPLRTPRKRTNAGKRKFQLSSSSPSLSVSGEDGEGEAGEGGSMPSTPSPVKARNPSIGIDDNEAGNKIPQGASKEKGKETVQDRRKKAKPTEAHMHPMELARNLEALLPRRPQAKSDVKQRGQGRSTKVSNLGGHKNPKGGKCNKGKAPRKGREETDDSDGEDEEERRLRQVRIDYFKKLDGYEVQTEDVYVV